MFSISWLQLLLASLFDVGGALETVDLHLFTDAAVDPSLDEVSDYTAPTFTGYASVPLENPAVTVDSEGNPLITWDTVSFTPSDAANLPQIIRGAILASSTDVIQAHMLDTPITLVHATQTFHVTPQFSIASGLLTLHAWQN